MKDYQASLEKLCWDAAEAGLCGTSQRTRQNGKCSTGLPNISTSLPMRLSVRWQEHARRKLMSLVFPYAAYA